MTREFSERGKNVEVEGIWYEWKEMKGRIVQSKFGGKGAGGA